jgi:hypothetical protein
MPPKQPNKPLSITEIVSVVYCEQKMIFDIERGRSETREVRAKREDGISRHKRFEIEGRRSQGRRTKDRRCFIATAVYGPDAFETDFLRGWRDRVLLPTRLGRIFVRLYYLVSPRLVPMLERHTRLASAVRTVLDRLVRLLEARR